MSRITMPFDDWLKEYKPIELNSDEQLILLPRGAEELRKYQTFFDGARPIYPLKHVVAIYTESGGYFGCLVMRKPMHHKEIQISFSKVLTMVLKSWDSLQWF